MRAALFAAVLSVTPVAWAQTSTLNTVVASGQTTSFASAGSTAADAALWLHPSSLSQSLILGVNGQDGLYTWALDGSHVATQAGAFSSVDVRYGFPLSNKATSVIASGTTDRALRFFTVNAGTRALQDVTGSVAAPAGPVACLFIFHPAQSTDYELFVASSSSLERFRLQDDGSGRINAQPSVPAVPLSGGVVTGCAADEAHGAIYLSVQTQGLLRGSLLDDGGVQMDTVATTASLGTVAGLGVLQTRVGGYVVLGAPGGSGGGQSDFYLFDRDGASGSPLAGFQLTFDAGTPVPVEQSTGLFVTPFAISSSYPKGLLIAYDGHNNGGQPNFKLVSWASVSTATGQSNSDPSFDPRLEGPALAGASDGGATGGGGGVTPGSGNGSPPIVVTPARGCRCNETGTGSLLGVLLLAGLWRKRFSQG